MSNDASGSGMMDGGDTVESCGVALDEVLGETKANVDVSGETSDNAFGSGSVDNVGWVEEPDSRLSNGEKIPGARGLDCDLARSDAGRYKSWPEAAAPGLG